MDTQPDPKIAKAVHEERKRMKARRLFLTWECEVSKADAAMQAADALGEELDQLGVDVLAPPDWIEPTLDIKRVEPIATKFIRLITVFDPDSQLPVTLEIRKMTSGPMVGIDGSYLEQNIGTVYSPYDRNVELAIPDNEYDVTTPAADGPA